MMKNKDGVTLISLMVIIILMFILAGVGINVSYQAINDVRDEKLRTELGIVRHAIVEQYSLAEATNKTMFPVTEENSFWIGERIEQFSNINLPKEDSINGDREVQKFYQKYNEYECKYLEDYYYRLTPEELSQIGIEDAKHTYIVNYKTGEVYNETEQFTSDSSLLYLPSTIYEQINTKTEDNTSFNDWNEEK